MTVWHRRRCTLDPWVGTLNLFNIASNVPYMQTLARAPHGNLVLELDRTS